MQVGEGGRFSPVTTVWFVSVCDNRGVDARRRQRLVVLLPAAGYGACWAATNWLDMLGVRCRWHKL